MSQRQEPSKPVTDIVRRALPHVNEHLDWAALSSEYDPEPEGSRLGMVLYKRGTQDPQTGNPQVAEAFGFHVAAGPQIELEEYGLHPAADEGQVYGEGDIITFQDTALKVLNPDKDLSLQAANYQLGDVRLNAANPVEKQMIWVIFSAIMERVVRELGDILPGEADAD